MKKRYNQAQREETVCKFKNSTDPKGAFTKSEGISVNTLNKWIEEVAAIKEKTPTFIKATIPQIYDKKSQVKIRFECFEIIVDGNTSEELLSLALRGVKAVC